MEFNTELFLRNQLSEALTKNTLVIGISAPVVARHTYLFIVEFKTTIAVFTVEFGVWSWWINSPNSTMGTLRTRNLTKLVEDFESHLQENEIKEKSIIEMLDLLTEVKNILPKPNKRINQFDFDYVIPMPDLTLKTSYEMIFKNKDTQDIPLYPKD
jgi:hypothetical protein